MKKFLVCFIIATVFSLALQEAQANLIDTGDPTGGFGMLFKGDAVAGKFTLAQHSLITNVQWYITSPYFTGSLTFKLLNDLDYAIPGGTVLYSSTYTVATMDDYVGAWHGPTGLAWDVAAGSYWLALYPDITIGIRDGVTNPLPRTAVFQEQQPSSYAWGPNATGYGTYGVKINYTIPEPTSMLLLGLGLMSLVGLGRKLKK